MRFIALILILALLPITPVPSAHAHMVVATNSKYYIRVIAHPEMIDYYSYGFCSKHYQKGSDKIDHLLSECFFPEGQQWWHLPNPAETKKRDTSFFDPNNYFNSKNKFVPNLMETLDEDNAGRRSILFIEVLLNFFLISWGAKVMNRVIPKEKLIRKVGDLLVLDPIWKSILKSTGRGAGALLFDGFAYNGFWFGIYKPASKALQDGTSDPEENDPGIRITHSQFQKTQPFTNYVNYIPETSGEITANDGTKIKSDYIGRLTLPKPFAIPVDPRIIKKLHATVKASSADTNEAFDICFKNLNPDPNNTEKMEDEEAGEPYTNVFIPRDNDCLNIFFEAEKLNEDNYEMCMNHCGSNTRAIRSSLSAVYDEYANYIPMITGTPKFKNPKDQSQAFPGENFLMYKDDSEVCELRCGDQWRTPTIKELWYLVSNQLARSDHHQYKRVVFPHKKSVLGDDVDEIDYITLEKYNEWKSLNNESLKDCPIGSECDRTHEFHKPHPTISTKALYKKITVDQLIAGYSKNVWKHMVPKKDETGNRYFDFSSVNDLIKKKNNTYMIRKDMELESFKIKSSNGTELDTTDMYNTESEILDINTLENGTYTVQIKFKGVNQLYNDTIKINRKPEEIIQYDPIKNLFFVRDGIPFDATNLQVYSIADGKKHDAYPELGFFYGQVVNFVPMERLPIGTYIVQIALNRPKVKLTKRVVVINEENKTFFDEKTNFFRFQKDAKVKSITLISLSEKLVGTASDITYMLNTFNSTPNDFSSSLDLSNLERGNYIVKIEYSSPMEKITVPATPFAAKTTKMVPLTKVFTISIGNANVRELGGDDIIRNITNPIPQEKK
jgi:hypothetical protein